MADISKIQVGSTTYDVTDKANHSALETEAKTYVDAINELNDALGTVDSALQGKQDKTDNSLSTASKTVVGAINELSEAVGDLDDGKIDKSSQAAKTEAMTQPVGIDSNGKLWALPGGGGDAGEVTYDPDETYDDGTVGSALQEKQKRIFFEEPESPQDGDIWIDEDDHSGDVAYPTAEEVVYDPDEDYSEGSIGAAVQEQSQQIVDTRSMISDAWTQRTYQPGEYAIDGNKLWKCLVANSQRPSEGANWTEVSVANELSIFTIKSGVTNAIQPNTGTAINGENGYVPITALVQGGGEFTRIVDIGYDKKLYIYNRTSTARTFNYIAIFVKESRLE